MEHTYDSWCLLYAHEHELPITVLCDACLWNIVEDRRVEAELTKSRPDFARYLGLVKENVEYSITMFALVHPNE